MRAGKVKNYGKPFSTMVEWFTNMKCSCILQPLGNITYSLEDPDPAKSQTKTPSAVYISLTPLANLVAHQNTGCVLQLPYNPDLAPCDFFLFTHL